MLDETDEMRWVPTRINDLIDALIGRAKTEHPPWERIPDSVYRSVQRRSPSPKHRLKPTDRVTWERLFGFGEVGHHYLKLNRKGKHHRKVTENHIKYILTALKELKILDDHTPFTSNPSTWLTFLDRAVEVVRGEATKVDRSFDILFRSDAASTTATAKLDSTETPFVDVRPLIVPASLEDSPPDILPRKPKNFTGRSTSAIHDALLSCGTVALHGLHGVGKTSLAAAYAEDYFGYYQERAWIPAQTDASIRASLVALGVRLGIRDEDKNEALRKVLEALRSKSGRILLIYDNANNVRCVKPYLPSGGTAHVIITSNSHNWFEVAKPIEIAVWKPEIGADFLVERLQRHHDRKGAQELSEALGGLPLALEQAAAYCGHCDVSFVKYITKFGAEPIETLDDQAYTASEYYPDVKIENKYRLTVYRTFKLAIDSLKGKDEEREDEETRKKRQREGVVAELTLVYAALLAPFSIPHFLFVEGRSELREPLKSAFSGDGFVRTVARLRDFALAYNEPVSDERDPSIAPTECIRLHTLVREIAASRAKEERESMRCELVAALADVYPDETHVDAKKWPRIRRLDAHAYELVHDGKPPKGAERQAIYLLNLLADYRHGSLAAYTEAQELFETSLALCESGCAEGALNPNDPLFAQALHGIAWLYVTRGRHEAAEAPFKKALAIRKKTLSEKHVDTAETRHRLAWLYVYQGRYKEAKPLLEELCLKGQGLEETEPFRKIDFFITLAWLYSSEGCYNDALRSHEYVRSIATRTHETDNTSINYVYNGLGLIYIYFDRKDEAENLFKLALSRRKKLVGDDHPETAQILFSLGHLCLKRGDLKGAGEYYRRARAIWKRRLGKNHIRYGRAIAAIAELRLCQNQIAKASILSAVVTRVRETACAPTHPDRAHSLLLQARLHMALSENRPAEALIRKAIIALKNSVTENHVWLRSANAMLNGDLAQADVLRIFNPAAV